MSKYVAFDPNVEVIGENVRGFIENSRRKEIQPYLEKHGLTDIKPDQWYPMQTWLDVLSELSESGGALFDFVSIGMGISETAMLPPGATELPFGVFMQNMNEFYQMQHRGGDAGEIAMERVSDRHIKMLARVPYPDDLEYGTTYGFAKRLLQGQDFTVYYDEDVPRREEGGETTIIHVTW